MSAIETQSGQHGIDYSHYPHLHVEDSPRKVMEIKSVMPANFRARGLMDIGCDAGVITKSVGQLIGAERVDAVEPSEDAISYARDNLQIFPYGQVHHMEFTKFNPSNKPDLTMLIDVLEHLDNPAEALKKAAALTRFSIIRTPLEGSMAVQIHQRLFGEDIQALMEQRYGHIHHYTKQGLKDLIEDNGFDIVRESITRIPQGATILDRRISKILESTVWRLLRSKYPDLWGGFYVAFAKSRERQVLEDDVYQKIQGAINQVLGESNVVSVIVFGSTTADRDKTHSDYDFTVIARDLNRDINQREQASPTIKKVLQDEGIKQLCAFNIYSPEEFASAARKGSWLVETMKTNNRIVYDPEGFMAMALGVTAPNVSQTGEFSWNGVSHESETHVQEVIQRYNRLSHIISPIDQKMANYYRREAIRGQLILRLFEHGEYDTRGSIFSLAKKLRYKYGAQLDLQNLQVEDFYQEIEGKKRILDYDSSNLHLRIADELNAQGLHLDALAHTYHALKAVYLRSLHKSGRYIVEGEITQLFVKEFAHILPKEVVDLIFANSFKAEQILGRSGFTTFDLDKEGSPLYEDQVNQGNNYETIQNNLRSIINSLGAKEEILKSSTSPKISIVIATYNRPDKIINCITALNTLLIPDDQVELIVVNDGSTAEYDEASIINSSKFPVKYVAKEHSGICGTKNEGIHQSQGDYVAFLDDDMVTSPFWLINLVAGFKNERIAGVGSTNLTYPDNNPISEYADYRELARRAFKDESGEILNVLTGSACIRRDVLLQVGGFNMRQSELGVGFGGDDVDLTWRIRNAGYSLNHVNEAVCFHNHRADLGSLIKQHVGYGEGTMFHCLDTQRDPESLGIPSPDYISVAKDLLAYTYLEVPKRMIRSYKDGLGLIRSLQYPLLDLLRRGSYDVGILKAKRFKTALDKFNK
ncbi:MAG: glycosyltransferase [Candidatus Levybacteria bacterium]|nr:glycosyltransferase [Candidatus Levybacteria bacterium]